MEEIIKMATRPGFVEVFWRRLQGCRRLGKMDTMQQIYNEMERECEAKYEHACFPSFQAFKKYLYRHH